ncbi:hypothetical protein [Mycobacterium sp. E3247]|uniref:hypothetical protein n=1 Tax=Mycobacterium sp. E3247 TaxID=1856864 RepID=UPI0007FEF8D5|nr:hypothetical protein [Mycobacterium sp. E3247]OBH21270.1 hypothetical protein A9X04_05600 [Mycobacterium sp. E3247]
MGGPPGGFCPTGAADRPADPAREPPEAPPDPPAIGPAGMPVAPAGAAVVDDSSARAAVEDDVADAGAMPLLPPPAVG